MQVTIKKPQLDEFGKPHYVNEMVYWDDSGAAKSRCERFETAIEAFTGASIVAAKFEEIRMSGGVLRDFLHEMAEKYR